ncbi:SDR family oxidoreductase [Paracidobacterium acidisoli]|uniref:SDR family oxidoreductase n=1 Tax=Paracidobacterium acidisoli TaxID=2303751 RepID=A0A372IMT9_9BACT|nr:SDR family oxidoreductase [Paracidobacterium acidisoli]MBT9331912.1 SDR family oxidoreductase [Paracidobacterium acidisoli]
MSTGKSRVWFITGASTGFGRRLAEAALAKGDRVVATARKPESVTDLQQQYPEHARAVRLDVTDQAQVKAAVQAAVDAFGRIDVLVNNAGYGLLGALEEVSDAQIRDQFETNLFGLLHVTRAVLPLLREQKSGHILNVTSVGGQVSFPGFGLYHGTKYAIEGISEALAKEVAGLGIKVTIVEPGGFKTDFATRSLASAERIPAYSPVYEALLKAFENAVFGDPARAAEAMIQAVDSEEPPLRLALGADALHLIRAKFQSELEEYQRWEPVTVATAYENPSEGAMDFKSLLG